MTVRYLRETLEVWESVTYVRKCTRINFLLQFKNRCSAKRETAVYRVFPLVAKLSFFLPGKRRI